MKRGLKIWLLPIIGVLLFLSCGSLKKVKQKEHSRTELSESIKAIGTRKIQSKSELNVLDIYDNTILSRLRIYNPIGTFSNGTFTGSADSIQQDKNTNNKGENVRNESGETAEKEVLKSEYESTQTADVENELLDKQRTPPSTSSLLIKYFLPALILLVIAIVLVYDKPRSIVLSFFKSLLKRN